MTAAVTRLAKPCVTEMAIFVALIPLLVELPLLPNKEEFPTLANMVSRLAV